MKICFVSLSSLPYLVEDAAGPYGGAEAQVLTLAKLLARNGHEISIITTNYNPEKHRSKHPELQIINAYNLNEGLPVLRFLNPRWTGLSKALETAKADVYFQMCAGAATGQIARYLTKNPGGFVFATASDADADPAQLELDAKAFQLYKYGVRRADEIISQHDRQAALLKQHWNLDSTPIAMSVDIPEEPNPASSEPTILWVGSFRSLKRPELWLEVAANYPDAKFIMVGGQSGAEPDVFEQAKATAAKLSNVEFCGAVPEVEPYLDKATILLNTSRMEGFPTTFLEAWVRGIPTVSYFDPDGLTAKHGMGIIGTDQKSILEGVGRLLADEKLRSSMGATGRQYVMDHHAPDVVAERVLKVMEQAIEKARKA